MGVLIFWKYIYMRKFKSWSVGYYCSSTKETSKHRTNLESYSIFRLMLQTSEISDENLLFSYRIEIYKNCKAFR